MQHEPGELGVGNEWRLWQSDRGELFSDQVQQGAMMPISVAEARRTRDRRLSGGLGRIQFGSFFFA